MNNFEKLNAQIDVWIDDEENERVFGEEKGAFRVSELDKRLQTHFVDCFRATKSTHDKDSAWYRVLNLKIKNPMKKVYYEELADGVADVDELWAPLFYAKLLRTHIKQKGTDCFNRRLDDVLQYLEKKLPAAYSNDDEKKKRLTQLTIIYLLELSAVSQAHESLGFSERTHRLIRQSKKLLTDEFSWFYDLWARYNIGVAYFHIRRYKSAIQEFNYIIQVIKETHQSIDNDTVDDKKKKEKRRGYFESHLGNSLIYIPSVLYRADIQLKLQLAYNALDTLNRYFWSDYIEESTYKIEKTPYKVTHGLLIQVEANRLTDNLNSSWDNLKEACGKLLNKDKGRILRSRVYQPPVELFNSPQKQCWNLKERFVDLFVEDELDWLKDQLNRLKSKEKALNESSNLTEDKKEYIKKDCEKIRKDTINCARMLKGIFSSKKYFKRVRSYEYDRQGYYQQLARFLAWLVDKDNMELFSDDTRFQALAIETYFGVARQLIQDEEKKDKAGICPYCEWEGFDLRKIHSEQYKWFTQDMLKFYKILTECYENEPNLTTNEQEICRKLREDKNKFVERLLKAEYEWREDLRIRDLELRYKSDEVIGRLKNAIERVTDESESGITLDKKCIGQLPISSFRHAFDNLLECVKSDDKDKNSIKVEAPLNSSQYKRIMDQFDKHFNRHLESESKHREHKNGLYFLGLQRWNSSSPAQGRSVGGGYLLYKTNDKGVVDLGIAIDPGFDFLRNLFHEGFSLYDIDIILISHAHMDHIRDFESIVNLLYTLDKRAKKRRKVHVLLSLGVYERLKNVIEDPTFRYFIEPYIIDVCREIDRDYFDRNNEEENLSRYKLNFVKEHLENSSPNGSIRWRAKTHIDEEDKKDAIVVITPTRAYHPDPSDYSDSFGFKIKVEFDETNKVTLGYTGDTKWVYSHLYDPLLGRKRENMGISQQYKDCDTLVVHIGSLIDDKQNFDDYNQCNEEVAENKLECEALVRAKDHPYLIGMIRLLSELCSNGQDGNNGKLILLSEFGEGLRGGIRTDLIDRLKKAYEHLSFLPLDVGMDIQLWSRSEQDPERKKNHKYMVRCAQCEGFVPIEDAEFERYGVDEALYCICKTCKKATPLNVLQDKLRQLYEVGLELRNDDGE